MAASMSIDNPMSEPDLRADFGIVTALRDEMLAVLGTFGPIREVHRQQKDIRYYYITTVRCLDGSDQTIVCVLATEMGQKPALSAAHDLIEAWRPRHLILVGIAGGIGARGVGYGDVIVPRRVHDYEPGKLAPGGRHQRGGSYDASPRLQAAVESLAIADSATWVPRIGVRRPDKRRSAVPRLIRDELASGEEVWADLNAQTVTEVLERFDKVVAVETEAAAVFKAADESPHKPDVLVVKGASDLVAQKDDRWRTYAARAASAFALALIQKVGGRWQSGGPVAEAIRELEAKRKVTQDHVDANEFEQGALCAGTSPGLPKSAPNSDREDRSISPSATRRQALVTSSASETPTGDRPPHVFVSYSHDSQPHRQRALALCEQLRSDGINCDIDQYYEDDPPGNWPRWMRGKVTDSEFVLVVCTEIYLRRFEGHEAAGKGLGASWEGAIITQELYNAQANNKKFIPLVFSRDDLRHIPIDLQSTTRYVLHDDYEVLLRRLTGQSRAPKPPLGTRPALPPTKPIVPSSGVWSFNSGGHGSAGVVNDQSPALLSPTALHQLPGDIGHFSGRTDKIDHMLSLHSDQEDRSISPSAIFCSECWLQTPGKYKAGAPKLWRFSLGDDGELSQTQEEDAHYGSVLRKTERTSGSVTVSPDGSLIAFLARGRVQFRGVDTREGTTYELPYQPDLRDTSQSTRVLAVSRRGNREVNLAMQNESGATLLRISMNGTTRLPNGISGYKTTSAAYLGQDLLYVQSLASWKGQTAGRHLLRQLREAGCDAEEAYCPVVTPPPSFADWNTLPVLAVDAVMMGGKPFVALLVARSSNRTERQTEERSLLIASVGLKPGEWTWRQHEVEATACSVTIVRNPYGQGGSLCACVGTALGSDSMQQYECLGDPHIARCGRHP